jgi:hypothetical protein
MYRLFLALTVLATTTVVTSAAPAAVVSRSTPFEVNAVESEVRDTNDLQRLLQAGKTQGLMWLSQPGCDWALADS